MDLVGGQLEWQAKAKCGIRIVKVILKRIQVPGSGENANKSNKTSSSRINTPKNQDKGLIDDNASIPSIVSSPGVTRSRPQRNRTKNNTSYCDEGNEDFINSNASCSDLEPNNTSDFELKLSPFNKSKKKIRNSKSTLTNNYPPESKTCPTKDHSQNPKKLQVGGKPRKQIQEPKVACSVCNLYLRRHHMKQHFQKNHPNESLPIQTYKPPTVPCAFCPVSIVHRQMLTHLQRKHPEQLVNGDIDQPRKVKCDLCPSVLLLPELHLHKKTQHPQTQFILTQPKQTTYGHTTCEFCPLSVPRSGLWQHIVNKHPEQLIKDDANSSSKIKCPLCPLVMHVQNLYMHKQTQHSLSKPVKIKRIPSFRCDLCSGKFITQLKLEAHILRAHVVDKPFECDNCFKSFLTKKLLQKHDKRAHENKTFNCNYCPTKSFKDSASLKKHMEATHKGYNEIWDSEQVDSTYMCPVCDTWFLTLADFTEHLKKPESESVMKCKICSEPAHTPCRLNLHQKKWHSKIPIVDSSSSRQPSQPEGIATPADSKQNPHKEKIITVTASAKKQVSPKTFSCFVCSAFFSRRCDLELHGLQEKHRRWKCSICAKLVSTKADLKYHIQSVHSDARPFKCTQKGCTSNFKLIQHLNKHMTMHDTSRVHCKECYKYISREKFREHVANNHDGDRKFKCDLCSKRWGTAYKLRQHLLSHTEERPFSCKFCDASYKCSKVATQHMKKCQFRTEDERKKFARYSNQNLRSAEQQRKSKKLDVFCEGSSNIKIAVTSQDTQSKKTFKRNSTSTSTNPLTLSCAPISFNENKTDLKLIRQEVDSPHLSQNSLDFDDTPETQVIKVKLEMVPKKEM